MACWKPHRQQKLTASRDSSLKRFNITEIQTHRLQLFNFSAVQFKHRITNIKERTNKTMGLNANTQF